MQALENRLQLLLENHQQLSLQRDRVLANPNILMCQSPRPDPLSRSLRPSPRRRIP